MIRDNLITHGNLTPSFYYWQPFPQPIDDILTAALTTLLSYQATAIFFDILLTRSQRFTTTSSHVQTVLLTDQPSVIPFLAAILRLDRLDRFRLRHLFSSKTSISRSPKRIAPSVLLRLLILLLLAPFFNLLSVILTLEHDQTLTFAQAKFGGGALGFTQSPLKPQPYAGPCQRLALKLQIPAIPTVQFTRCNLRSVEGQVHSPTTSYIVVFHEPAQIINIQYAINGYTYISAIYADVRINDDTHRIKSVIDKPMMRQFLTFAIDVLNGYCDPETVTESNLEIIELEPETALFGFMAYPNCTNLRIQQGQSNLVLDQIASSITLIDSESLQIEQKRESTDNPFSDDPNFLSVDDFIFMKRRRRNVSPAVLAITVACVLMVRLCVGFITRNTVYDAMEAIVTQCAGVPPGASLLGSEQTLKYTDKSDFVRSTSGTTENVVTTAADVLEEERFKLHA